MGRDYIASFWHAHRRYFNPRARVGRDHGDDVEGGASRISIHAPAWGATHCEMGNISDRTISIHAPAWGATYDDTGYALPELISIHAPAWGATIGWKAIHNDCIISIHAPAWGATSKDWQHTKML